MFFRHIAGLKQFLTFIFLIFIFINFLYSQYTFVEQDGMVSIEAEHYSANMGPWEEVEGRNAVSINEAGRGAVVDSKIIIRDGDHPVAGGFTGTVSLVEPESELNWGIPNENAQIIAVSQKMPSRPVLFVYSRGMEMPGLTAPEKRIGMFIRTATITPEGWQIFAATVRWIVNDRPDSLREVLFVKHTGESNTMDSLITKNIEKLGYVVQQVEDDDVEQGHARAKAFIIISESINSNVIGSMFRNVDIPVIISEPQLYDDMGMIILRPVWKESAGQFPNAMMIRRGKWSDYLKYSIYFKNPGTYNLWLLGKNGGDEGSDEVKIFFDADSIYSDALYYEVRFDKFICWTNQMFFKTPVNRKTPGKAEINVKKPGWHNLYLVKGSEPENSGNPPDTRMYPNWRVDKILIFNDDRVPEGDGPTETRNQQQVEVPDTLIREQEFLPGQIWVEMNGYVIIEAEAIDHSEQWELLTTPKGFTGKGYLQWQGPDRTVSIEGMGGNDDELYIRQGPQEEWLILRVFISNPGNYRVNVRNIHAEKDGDNDAWIAKLGFRPNKERDTKIVRLGDSHNDGEGFTWLDWGIRRFWLGEGLNELYIGGRSVGFGIDRIVLYKDDNETAKSRALDVYMPVSKLKK